MVHQLLLNCSILGPNVGRTFLVEILPSKTVSQLKDEIKKENENKLAHIDDNELDIWKVSDSVQHTHHR